MEITNYKHVYMYVCLNDYLHVKFIHVCVRTVYEEEESVEHSIFGQWEGVVFAFA